MSARAEFNDLLDTW